MKKWTYEAVPDSRPHTFRYRIPEAGFESYCVDFRNGRIENAARLMAAAPELFSALKEIVQIELDQDEESRNVTTSDLEKYVLILEKAMGRVEP